MNAEWQANNFNTASSDNVVNSHSFITAWDVTVQSGSSFVSGRVYSTVFNFGMGNSASASKNGFFGKYYVLTRDGFTYEVDNNGHNGLSYNSFVNNTGTLVDNTDTQSYQSFSYPSSNVASTIKAKLHDLVTGNNYPILNNAEYVIAGTNASSTNRFKVMASSSGSILKNTESSLINVDVRSNIVFVENQTKEDCVANIYDITGRLIINKQVPKNQIVKFTELSQGRAAIYIVRVISGNKSINKTDRVLLK